ncbi:MAG: hypothetical protein Q4G51_01320 [Dermatophilus congolensis]|nr:hypothetical protein [Dermatophilus congolensis]
MPSLPTPDSTTRPGGSSAVSASDARVYRYAMVFTVVTVALGSMVCATDSSSACPAWPVCYADQVGPAVQTGWLENPAIEFIHRVISFTCLVLLGYAGWVGRKYSDVRLRVFPWVGLAMAIGSAVFGMMIVLFTLPLALGLLDLGFALVAAVLITVASQAASGRTVASTDVGARRVRALAGTASGVLVAMHLFGSYVAGRTDTGFASFTRCLSWPMWHVLDIDGHPELQRLRIGLAVSAIVLIGAAVALAWARPRLRSTAALVVALLVAEIGLGLKINSQGLASAQTNGIDAGLAVSYALTAVALFWAVARLLGRAWPSPVTVEVAPSRETIDTRA